MLLQRLSDYAGRLELPPTLYAVTPVRYIIRLASDGTPVSQRPIDTADPSNPRTRRGEPRAMPQVARAVGIKPLLLADNAEYTLGLAREGSRPDRVSACHRAYLDIVRRCARATNEPVVSAVLRFLESAPPRGLDLPDDFDPGALVTFQVDGVFPTELESVQGFWADEHDPARADAKVMQCLVCGQERSVLERLQAKVKGVPGGQTAGTSIISANAEAFESYGLRASLIAPTCAACGERFTKAANDLLRDPTSRIVMGGSAFIFWTRDNAAFSLLDFFDSPRPEQVRDLIAAVRAGGPRPAVDEMAFYATVLSGSGGRTVVRDWIDTTIGEVKKSLSHWFAGQWIVDEFGGEPRPLGLFALAAGTVRDAAKELAPPTMRSLLRSALTGAPLPLDLLARAARRNRAERRVTRQRAALIKLVLSTHDRSKEEVMVQLAPDHPSRAYHCGRLLAVIEEVQRAALGEVNATVVDRFYGTAASAPASVFHRLLGGARPHLAKLRRDRPTAYAALQQRLESVMGHLDGFPRILTAEGQGLFALGFYHQRAFDRQQARERAERRKAQDDTTTGEPMMAEITTIEETEERS